MSAKEHKPPDKESEDEPSRKKTCIRCSKAPGVVIVVGGEEFFEYESSLRCWSGFFDAAFRSGMKESESSTRFEFPDRDPKEWELIVALMAPMATKKVNKDNIDIAISWFDELASDIGLQECDRILASEIIPQIFTGCEICSKASWIRDKREKLDELQDALDISVKCSRLPRSKAKCLKVVRRLLGHAPILFDVERLEGLCSFMKDDKECRDELWLSFKDCLSIPSLTVKQQKGLLSLDLVHKFVRPWLTIKWDADDQPIQYDDESEDDDE